MIVTASPPEPRAGDVISPESVPGLGVVGGELIDWYAVNAYAELVGWRCRFLPNVSGSGADIIYPDNVMFDDAARLSYAVDPRRRDSFGRLVT